MRNRQLIINFAPNARRVNRLGVLLLCISVCIALAFFLRANQAWMEFVERDRISKEINNQLDQVARQSGAQKRDVKTIARERVALYYDQLLQTPWNELLGAIESHSTGSVELLSVEPSITTNTVRVLLNGASFDAMLAYVDELSRDPRLVHVELESHDIQSDVEGAPIGFRVTARWNQAHL